jgi:hypothetical protein
MLRVPKAFDGGQRAELLALKILVSTTWSSGVARIVSPVAALIASAPKR